MILAIILYLSVQHQAQFIPLAKILKIDVITVIRSIDCTLTAAQVTAISLTAIIQI